MEYLHDSEIVMTRVSFTLHRISKFVFEGNTIAIALLVLSLPMRGRNYSYELSRSSPARASKYESYALASYERPRGAARTCAFGSCHLSSSWDRTKVSKTAPSRGVPSEYRDQRLPKFSRLQN